MLDVCVLISSMQAFTAFAAWYGSQSSVMVGTYTTGKQDNETIPEIDLRFSTRTWRN